LPASLPQIAPKRSQRQNASKQRMHYLPFSKERRIPA
jgi:hypothetical protein